MKKSASYYTRGFRRKMLAQVFHKGIIATERQTKVITDLLGAVDQPIQAVYSDEYKAFKYLDSDYKDSLKFQDGVAVAEKGGSSCHLFNEYSLR